MKEQSNRKINLVDRYLHGDMSADERVDFEHRLKEDPELEELLNIQKDIDEVILDREALDFASTLDAAYDTYKKSRKSISRHKQVYRLAGIAAMLLVFLGIGFVIRQQSVKLPLNQAIVKKYYRPYEVPVNYRSAEGTVDATFRLAVEKYNDKQYSEAIRLFEQVLKEDDTRMDANLMNGLSNFEIKNYKRADSSFRRIIKHRDNLYIQQAQWYLGFCFLMTNQDEKAVKLYRKIVDEKGFYSKKAEKILKKLKAKAG